MTSCCYRKQELPFLTKMAVKKDSSTKSDWILIPSQNSKSSHWQIPPGHNGNIQSQGSLKYRAETTGQSLQWNQRCVKSRGKQKNPFLLLFFFFWKQLKDDESKETFASLFQNSESFLLEPGAGRGSTASTEMGVEMAQMHPAPNQEAHMWLTMWC